MASIVAGSADSGADQEFQRIQEVVELPDPDAPVNLDDDGIFALQIALDLSATEMEEVKDLVIRRLDPHGTGTLTREAWRAVSAEWHTSGKSFLDFVTTSAPPIAAETEADTQQPAKKTMVGTARTTGINDAAGQQETKVTVAAVVDDNVRALLPPFHASCLASLAGPSALLGRRPPRGRV